MTSYYVDTCVWRDYFENRFGQRGRPLGEFAAKFFFKAIKKRDVILFSDLLVKELKTAFSNEEIEQMLGIVSNFGLLKLGEVSKNDFIEAQKISGERALPFGDVLHAIASRNNNAVLITQDKHFEKLRDFAVVKRPQEI